MKKHVFLALSFCTAMGIQAQIEPLKTGENTADININDAFSYIGNFFNQTENNSLYFSGASLVYRKITAPNRAIRYSVFANLERNKSYYPYTTNPYNRTTTNSYINFAVGKEYFKHVGKKNAWRPYAGWQWGIGFSQYTTTYDYDSKPEIAGTRVYKNSDGLEAFTGFDGFLGVNYFLNNQIYLGLEVIASSQIGYNFGSTTETEVFVTTNSGTLYQLPNEVAEGQGGLIWDLSNYYAAQFRLGIRF